MSTSKFVHQDGGTLGTSKGATDTSTSLPPDVARRHEMLEVMLAQAGKFSEFVNQTLLQTVTEESSDTKLEEGSDSKSGRRKRRHAPRRGRARKVHAAAVAAYTSAPPHLSRGCVA